MNPLKEKGIPIEKQIRTWRELNIDPVEKETANPYTLTRIILMNGIETDAALFGHHFARHTPDLELKRQLAMVRRAEQQQQKMVNWLLPRDASPLETTISYEQVAVDLTAYLAQIEKDPYVKSALDFALLEDFDHLYRYANLLLLNEDKRAEMITKDYTEITVGRPTVLEHRHPFDEIRNFAPKDKADFSTCLHILTILAAEQQTMNYYMNVGPQQKDKIGRGLYQEIGQVEEQHVTHYESLMDPTFSWFEREVLHEYNECWLYHSLMKNETDAQVKTVWEMHLLMEIEHLKIACELMKKHQGKDPEETLLPQGDMPTHFKFQSNIDYVRDIMKNQTDYNAFETEFLPPDKYPDNPRYSEYQMAVNDENDFVPSKEVTEKVITATGIDYRHEVKGDHPIDKYRQKEPLEI